MHEEVDVNSLAHGSRFTRAVRIDDSVYAHTLEVVRELHHFHVEELNHYLLVFLISVGTTVCMELRECMSFRCTYAYGYSLSYKT